MRSLDDVISDLDAIVAERRAADGSAGLFAAMYRSVTHEVRRSVRNGGFFDDDERMERTAVVFADRYIDAYHRYYGGETATASWTLAFDCCESRVRRTILQHLLLGMNAHINLDLGIAFADATDQVRLPEMYADFQRVNEILCTLVDELQDGLDAVSPRMSWLDRMAGSLDETFMRMGIRKARDFAWSFAQDLCAVGPEERSPIVGERDRDTTMLGHAISWRWSPIHIVARVVAVAERHRIGDAIDAFDAATVDLDEVAGRIDAAEAPPDTSGMSLLDLVPQRRGVRGFMRAV